MALIKARALDYVRHVTCTVVDKPWARAGTREDEDDEEEEEDGTNDNMLDTSHGTVPNSQ